MFDSLPEEPAKTACLKTTRLRRAFLAIVSITLFLAACSGAGCGVAAGIVLADRINKLLNEVGQTIQTATANVNLSELSAANDIQSLLYNIASAYGPQLNQAINTDLNNTLDRIQGDINSLNNNVQVDIAQIVNGTQQIANTLPFAHLEPQVRSYSPKLISNLPGEQAKQLRVQGNFFYSFEKKLTPTAKVNNITIPANEVLTGK